MSCGRALFATLFLTVFLAFSVSVVAEDPASKPGIRHGYAQCVTGKDPPPVPVFEHPCKPRPVAQVQCGQPVDVVRREGPWLAIKAEDGTERYMGYISVSLSEKKFLPVDLPAPAGPYVPDCSAFLPTTHPPISIYRPAPNLSKEAIRDKVSGSVQLSLTVGTDGMAHDVEVTKSLGHGLDEEALRVAPQWRFEPAAKDGKPVSARIAVEVGFTAYK